VREIGAWNSLSTELRIGQLQLKRDNKFVLKERLTMHFRLDDFEKEECPMKTIWLGAAVLAFALANAAGQAKVLTNDPLTGLPLIPATVQFKNVGNEPDKMPDGQVCRSKMQGNSYSLSNLMNPASGIKMEAAAAWYASRLSGYKKVQGYASGRSQIAFYNSDRTIVIFWTGQLGAQGENPDAFSVAYERYQPGISEKTIVGLTQGNRL